jgi:branched-subunit amino acid aminotransferase/4-amino-4-deoxychorismate lyase
VTGLFETMLAIDRRIVQLDDHVARMARSSRELDLAPLDEQAFRDAARRVVQDGEHAVRVVFEDGAITATAFAIPPITRSRREQGRAVTLQRRRPVPQHKRFPEDLHLRTLIPEGADEALFTTDDGAILEGTSTNVFAIRGDVLITAPDGVLPGVVRAWVLATGLEIESRPPTTGDILSGAFFTGSLTTLAPIRTLDGRTCAPPGAAFAELVRSYHRNTP